MLRLTFVALVAMLCLSASACGASQTSVRRDLAPATREERARDLRLLRESITKVATKADNSFEEGWICNRNARVLKTGYARVAPQDKADFAIAYRKMLEDRGENLANDLKTYVPFKARAQFALDYWRKSSYKDAFEKETKKKKVQWLYESVLDAGELFFRAYELVHPDQVNSAAVLAHYKEQDMVFNYMEDESTPGSFSEQYVNWTEVGKGEGL